MLPLADALNCRVAMVERDGELLAVMGAPLDRRARLWLQARFEGRPVLFALALPGAVDAWLKQAEASERVLDGVAVDVAEDTLARRWSRFPSPRSPGRKPGDPAGEHDAL